MEEMAETNKVFAVVAEANGYERALIQTELPFGRLMDEIVKPFQGGEPFFVDGAPLTRDKIRKLKFLEETDNCKKFLYEFHWRLRTWNDKDHKHLAEQYDVRVEAILRETGKDVTAQIIKAFDNKIKPGLRDYIPKREELINAALQVFLQSIKTLGGA